MIQWIRSLICRHEYERVGDRQYEKHRGFIVMQTKYRCKRCGKEIYK